MRMHSLNWWMYSKQSNIILRNKRMYFSLFSKLSNVFIWIWCQFWSKIYRCEVRHVDSGGILDELSIGAGSLIVKKYFGSYFELRKIGAYRCIELIHLYCNGSLDESVHVVLFEDSCKKCESRWKWPRTRSNKTRAVNKSNWAIT
jgi:hypothetical protein